MLDPNLSNSCQDGTLTLTSEIWLLEHGDLTTLVTLCLTLCRI